MIELNFAQVLKHMFGLDDEMIVDRIVDRYAHFHLFHHIRISFHNESQIYSFQYFHQLYKNYDFVVLKFLSFI